MLEKFSNPNVRKTFDLKYSKKIQHKMYGKISTQEVRKKFKPKFSLCSKNFGLNSKNFRSRFGKTWVHEVSNAWTRLFFFLSTNQQLDCKECKKDCNFAHSFTFTVLCDSVCAIHVVNFYTRCYKKFGKIIANTTKFSSFRLAFKQNSSDE